MGIDNIKDVMTKRLASILILLPLLFCVGAKEEKKSKLPDDNQLPYFITTSVFPVGKGIFEVIVQPEYYHGKEESDLALLMSFSYGPTETWTGYINIYPYIIHQETELRTSGFGDIDIGLQNSWIYINKSTFSASVLFNAHIPTADINKGLTDGFLRYEPYIILTKDFNHETWRTQFFAQIGFSFVQRLKEPADEEDLPPSAHSFIFNGGVAARFEKVNYSVEINWETNTWNGSGDNSEAYVTPGIYVQVKDKLALGVGVPIGITRDAANYAIIGNLLVDIDTLPSKEKDKDDKDKKDKNKKVDFSKRASQITHQGKTTSRKK